jgi:dihydroorotate dehydrogenase
MKQAQLYDDQLGFEVNKAKGPFGDWANDKISYKNQGSPKHDFFGVPVYSPFGIAAGPLPTPKFIGAALNKGFDIVTLKSVRTEEFPLNLYPQVRPVKFNGNISPTTTKVLLADEYSNPLAVANSFGIPSVAPHEWQISMKESFGLLKKGQALLVAFQGTARGKGRDAFVKDHLKGIKLIRETGAKIIEINLSCPNEGKETLTCFDIDMTTQIVSAVREANPDIKLIIKLAYFTNKTQLKKLVRKVGSLVDGISAINNIAAPVLNKNGKEVFPGRLAAGISGAPIKWAGLEMVENLKKIREELGYSYKIIGIGGVLSSDDFNAYRNCGADTVMSVTGAMWNPRLAAEIKSEL